MDNRFNTIAGWVLGAGIVALGGSIVTAELFHAERPEKMGYPIEGVSDADEEGVAAEQPIAVYLAAADPAKGAQVFAKCTTCHTITKGGANGSGPNLWGTVGGPVGHAAGFPYTADLQALGGTRDWEKLSQWVKSPRALVQGTKMSFAGLSKPEDRANLLAYMNAQSDAPQPLPAAPAPAAAAPAAGADGKAADQPVLNEAQAVQGPGKNIGGDGAPAVSGNSAQTKIER